VTPQENAIRIKQIAAKNGFHRCGIAKAAPIGRVEFVRRWLDQGRAGSMDYLHRHLSKRLDPRELLSGAKSIIVTLLSYNQRSEPTPQVKSASSDVAQGRVAMYAWGDDYHEVIREKLELMMAAMREEIAESFDAKICVDTAPIIEREWAAAAGVGWIGKNTLILNEALGSFTFLGLIVTTLDLQPDAPVEDHCGSCTACLDACPTKAFPNPYQMDASRCISYLTIEHRGDISKPFQEMMSDWVFGCDICLDVCPFNRKAPPTDENRFLVRDETPKTIPLDELATWTTENHRARTTGSAMNRAKLPMFHRNARIALNNSRNSLNSG